MKTKKLTAVCTAILLFLLICPLGAFAAERPSLSVTSAEGTVGEDLTVTISMKNVQGLTSADITLYYNPYMLYFKGLKMSDALESDSNVVSMSTEQLPRDATDRYGEPINCCVITLVHLEQFPQSLNNCELATLTFEAISGGNSPLVLAANSFYVNEEPVEPEFISGSVSVTGDAPTSEWNYAAHADEDIMFTDESFTFESRTGQTTRAQQSNAQEDSAGTQESEKKSSAKTILIIAVVLVAVLLAVAAITINARKKMLSDDTDDTPNRD